MTMDKVITFLTNLDVQKGSDYSSLEKENRHLKEENEVLKRELILLQDKYESIQEDYRSLIEIMNRARQMIVVSEEERSEYMNGKSNKVKK